MTRTLPGWVGQKQTIGLKHGFRSGLEDRISKQIEGHGAPVLFETFRVPYEIPTKLHHYTPDFLLPNGIIVEAKGIFDSTDRAKHLFVQSQYPELDIRFVFTRSKAPINKGSKTTLADWCAKYGYRFADKLIPDAWFAEPGPTLDPMAVLKAGPFGFAKGKR